MPQVEERSDIIAWFAGNQPIEVRTRAVFDDEPALYLGEFNLPARNSKGMNRYQVLRAIRNDRVVTARVYLGPSAAFTARQFQIPGGEVFPDGRGRVWHTVAELRECADELRGIKNPDIAPSNLQTAFRNMVEERGRRRRHASTFGPKGHIQ